MKYTIDSNHRDYFLEHQAIEFDALIDPIKLSSLHQALSRVLDTPYSDKIFIQGRDLWRSSDFIRKVVTQKKLAQIASDLTEKKIIRLGFDELIPTPGSTPGSNNATDPYHNLLDKKIKLAEFTGLQGVLSGLVLCLQGGGAEALGVTPFSTQPGNGVFLGPDFEIDFKELYERPGYLYFLIVYCQSSTVYVYQANDPHPQVMKALGYSYGDTLKDKLNPILLR